MSRALRPCGPGPQSPRSPCLHAPRGCYIKPREFSYCCWPGEIRPKDTKGDIATHSSYVDSWAMFGLNLHIMASNTSVHLNIGYHKHVMLVIYFPYWNLKRPFRCIHHLQPVSQILQIYCFRNPHHIVFGVASLSCLKGFEKLQNLSPSQWRISHLNLWSGCDWKWGI